MFRSQTGLVRSRGNYPCHLVYSGNARGESSRGYRGEKAGGKGTVPAGSQSFHQEAPIKVVVVGMSLLINIPNIAIFESGITQEARHRLGARTLAGQGRRPCGSAGIYLPHSDGPWPRRQNQFECHSVGPPTDWYRNQLTKLSSNLDRKPPNV